MKQRDPIVTLLLSLFVPFYAFYWFYATSNEVRLSRNVNMPSNSKLFWSVALLVGNYVILWPIVAIMSALAHNSAGLSILVLLFSLLMPVAVIAGIVLLVMYYYAFSQAIVQVIGNEMTPGILTVLMVFIAPVPIYIIQEKLNHLGQAPQSPTAPTPPSPAA